METKKTKDRHLDIPSEANRDKHINFTALENDDTDPSDNKERGKLAAEEKEKGRSKKKNKK